MSVTELEGPAHAEAESSAAGRVVRSPEELSAAREDAEISLQQMADRLRMNVTRVSALEAGHWDQLPSRAFARAALRTFARQIGVNAAPLIDSVGGFGEAAELRTGMRPQVAVPVATASMLGRRSNRSGGAGARRHLLVPAIAGAVLLLVILVTAGLDFGSGGLAGNPKLVQVPIPGVTGPAVDKVSTTNASVAVRPAIRTITTTTSGSPGVIAAAPAALVPAAIRPSITATLRQPSPRTVGALTSADPAAMTFPVKMPATEPVKLTFSKATWVDIRHKDGEKLLFGTQKARKTLVLNGVPPMQLVIGNPDGVKILFRGKLVDLKGATRKGVSRLVLN